MLGSCQGRGQGKPERGYGRQGVAEVLRLGLPGVTMGGKRSQPGLQRAPLWWAVDVGSWGDERWAEMDAQIQIVGGAEGSWPRWVNGCRAKTSCAAVSVPSMVPSARPNSARLVELLTVAFGPGARELSSPRP